MCRLATSFHIGGASPLKCMKRGSWVFPIVAVEHVGLNALLFALADFGTRVIGAVSGEAAEAQPEASLQWLLDEQQPHAT